MRTPSVGDAPIDHDRLAGDEGCIVAEQEPDDGRDVADGAQPAQRRAADDLRGGDQFVDRRPGAALGVPGARLAPRTGAQVRVENMRSSWWASRFAGARRSVRL